MYQKYPKYIVKALADETIVWFESSNNYILLKPPAYSVFVLLQGGMNVKKIIEWFSLKYRITAQDSRKFVNEVKRIIKEQSEHKYIKEPDENPIAIKTSNHEWQYVKSYLFKGVSFNLHFNSKVMEGMFHPLLKHLEVEYLENGINYFLFTFNDYLIFQHKNTLVGKWQANNSHFFKGKVFMQLLNDAYQKTEEDWLCVLHAAAVCDNHSCLIFAGQSGCGKSTMCALLQASGFDVLADDFVPVEASFSNVLYFPAAISVKERAKEVLSGIYPELEYTTVYPSNPGKKSTRYLSPINSGTLCEKGYPVKAIIFPCYDETVELQVKEIQQSEAFKKLIPDSWLSPIKDNVKKFLYWFSELPCYSITYSDNKKMLSAVEDLFAMETKEDMQLTISEF